MKKAFSFEGKPVPPKEKKDKAQVEGELESLSAGKFGLTQDEVREIIDKAIKESRNPLIDIQKASQRMDEATGRLRAAQGEKARKSLERHLKKNL